MRDGEMRGTREAIYDLLLDAGARFERGTSPTAGEASVLWGIPVIYDGSMPREWVDMRNGDGVLTKRFVQVPDGSWVAIDGAALAAAWWEPHDTEGTA